MSVKMSVKDFSSYCSDCDDVHERRGAVHAQCPCSCHDVVSDEYLRVEALEERVDELEARLAKLEANLAKA